MATFSGIEILQSSAAGADRIVFRQSFADSSGAELATGSPTVELYELQSDGTFKSYDFSSNTFKTTALTTATLALTHRTGNNGTTATGVWTAILTTLTGFAAGNIYLAKYRHSGASPTYVNRQFQYGGSGSDLVLSAAGTASINAGQTGWTPRDLSAVADASLTTADLLIGAMAGSVGDKAVSGTTFTIKTPGTATTVASKTLDSSSSPTSAT